MEHYFAEYVGRKINIELLKKNYEDKFTFHKKDSFGDSFEISFIEEDGALSGDVNGFEWKDVKGRYEERLSIKTDSDGYIKDVHVLAIFKYGNDFKSYLSNKYRAEYNEEIYFSVLDDLTEKEDRISSFESYIGRKISKTYVKTFKNDKRYSVSSKEDRVVISLDPFGPLKITDSEGKKVHLEIYVYISPKSLVENILVYAKKQVKFPNEEPVDYKDYIEEAVITDALEIITSVKQTKKILKKAWTCFYWISYGRNDYSDRVEFEIDISPEEAQILDKLNEVQNDGVIDKDYHGKKINDFIELADFKVRVEEYAKQAAYEDMLNISKKEAKKVTNGEFLVQWDYGIVE